MGDDVFPTYTEAELKADAIVHAIGVTAGLHRRHHPRRHRPAAAADHRRHRRRRLRLRHAGHVLLFRRLQSVARAEALAAQALRPRRHLHQDRRHLYALRRRQDGRHVGLLLLAAVWGIALAGAAAKLIVPHRVASVSTLLYLAQGWMCIFSMQPLLAALSPTAMTLLIVGGVLYSVGAVFHLSERLPYHNAIWHGFVLVASACHFAAVTDAVVLG